ncbi:hypothetical protein [Comamonas sp. JC664]|uniref:hypothetical protein n=1 Tax=Comamonas sp. JC664 TaxID=2801917 RepID=UPI001748FF3A|nr:hypothetical protein [Comamonas sp. JC664]MBL0698647.1 hypothetical protein [Comamonas sp. JC664]GHG78328.1 hypothetical protein GCM10012319_28730 [Comamonas sp. KCTC 72670]
MKATRGWKWVGIALCAVGVGFSCGQRSEDRGPPSASEREGRSDILQGLMASRERGPGSGGGTAAVPTEPLGQGGSGRPEPSGQLQGHVSWVGDNELLIKDAQGEEHDVGVDDQTLLYMQGEPVSGLREFHEGDAVRVTYGDGPGGLVAHLVVGTPGPGPHQGDASPEASSAEGAR